eukprot:Em0020g132a
MSTLPRIQISVDHELLPEDLRVLLKEVEQLRETADKIVCWCSELDCPFKRPGSLHLALSDTKSSLPISRDVVSDCDVVDDDQTSESNQNSVFLRREPARIGTAPNKRRICPSPRSRARVGSVPNTESVLNRLTVPQRYSELIFTPHVCVVFVRMMVYAVFRSRYRPIAAICDKPSRVRI